MMEKANNENKMIELKDWAKEVMELLDEVKPYRSVFYKQRVAKLKDEFKHITNGQACYKLRNTLS
ncbi:hypothetical protein BDD43_1362 [Mucilaginibacter gracilis]|uniref:Uncharacterized protein n=1 Tax=Mucilaginibacter gracilis TaxID=423350 RepID=A0A495IWV3_9SPHI|nr:hypothetical protein [Mucilaginibacter gracilis]RKR81217.1 hypothetical protein BDD43_1362 [Mucilaginibacter gracilis]